MQKRVEGSMENLGLALRSEVTKGHIPVLEKEVLSILTPKPGDRVLDCTLGLGGHALAFLEATAPDGRLIGLDADAANLLEARKRLELFGGRVELHNKNFRDASAVTGLPAEVVFADLGLSPPHIDNPEGGSPFRCRGDCGTSAPADMRYDRSTGQSATEFLQSASEDGIVRILK